MGLETDTKGPETKATCPYVVRSLFLLYKKSVRLERYKQANQSTFADSRPFAQERNSTRIWIFALRRLELLKREFWMLIQLI